MYKETSWLQSALQYLKMKKQVLKQQLVELTVYINYFQGTTASAVTDFIDKLSSNLNLFNDKSHQNCFKMTEQMSNVN